MVIHGHAQSSKKSGCLTYTFPVEVEGDALPSCFGTLTVPSLQPMQCHFLHFCAFLFLILLFKMIPMWGFPGGTVVEGLPANAGDTGSGPGLGRSHMPQSGWAREPQLLSLRVWSLCSATREARASR